MDVPSPAAGTVREVHVKLGDKVSEGTLIVVLEAAAAAAQPAAATAAAAAQASVAPAGAAPAKPAPATAPVPGAATLCRQGGHRVRDAGARRGPRRLQRGVSRRRSGHEDGARRALSGAGRRVPQRRLHSVEGAAAHRGRGRRDEAPRRARHRVRGAAGRPRDAARMEGQGGRQADRRSRRHGEVAQGRRRARHRPVPRSASSGGRGDRGTGAGEDRREEGRQVPAGDHRRGLAGRAAAVHPRGSARARLDARARARGASRSGCW